MVSQFNPLFNGEQALLKGKQKLATSHVDDYDKTLQVFPNGTKESAASVKPDMDKAIEKATKVIQRHSMMIRNDQKNKVIDDSYMLIGKARYYNREYLEALETFNYVIQEFPHSKVHDAAILWAAKTETALGNYLSAKERFEKIYRSEDLSRKLKAETFASYAQLQIDAGSMMAAYQLLEQAVERTRDKQQEVRWLFIMGQLQSQMGNDFEASKIFKQVIKKGPPYELLFQAQLARARNYDVDLQDPEEVFDELKDMLEDDKNLDNKDQIYYVMAEIAEKMGDDELMKDYLKKSVRASTTNATQKALSYLKLAETNFRDKEYPLAAAYYDSSYTSLPATHDLYPSVERKKESLAGLIENLRVIELQDSLLMLAGLSEKQRLEKIRNIIKKEQEEAERKEWQEQNRMNSLAGADNSMALAGQSAIQGGKWYFYNQNLRSSGVRNFMNRFGNRELEDNWRRKEKNSMASFEERPQDGAEVGENENDELAASAGNREEEYLKSIPQTEEEIQEGHQKIIQAYLNIGNIYKNDLKDQLAAERQFKDLLGRYPDINEKGRVWYTLYRINVAEEDASEADHYKKLILQNLPDSEYAALLNGAPKEDLNSEKMAVAYYKKTYKSFKEGMFRKSLSMADSGISAYASSQQAPQFMLIKAYSLANNGKREKMEETLNALIAEYPQTEQAKEAQRILSHVSSPGEENQNQPAGNNEMAAAEDYKVDEQEEHKYIALVPNMKGLVNNVTIDIIDHNKKYFKNLNLNTKSVYISPEQQMVMVSGLPNNRKAMQYFEFLKQQNVLEKNLKPKEIKHFVISNSNFTKVYSKKDFEGYLKFFENKYL